MSDDSEDEKEEEKITKKERKKGKNKGGDGGEEDRKEEREDGRRLYMIRKKTTSFGRSFSTLPTHTRGGGGAPPLTKMCVGEYLPLPLEEESSVRFDPPGGWHPLKTRFFFFFFFFFPFLLLLNNNL